MLSFDIPEVKPFMAQLLKGETFDGFCLHTAQIVTYASFLIEGNRVEKYYSPEEMPEGKYCTWKEIKPLVFQLVRGNKLPVSMKFVFFLLETQTAAFPNASALFLNLVFSNGKVRGTTAVAQTSFSLQKDTDIAWEAWIKDFFQRENIPILLDV